ncbi:8773_t:CDS:2, partial [Gigaspora rosea]
FKKSKERLVAEHWQIEDQDNYVEHLKLQPCKGCTFSTSLDVNSCYRHFNKKESLGTGSSLVAELSCGKAYTLRSFWDLKKKQNGIHCTSLFQSKQLATQIKCLANKLPVLDELKKCKLSLYTSNEYICCKVKATEMQDHLADYNYYEWSWINITKVAARVTWSKLSSTDQFLLPLVSYYQLVVGSHMQEIIELRRSYMRVWNGFYESIWKEWCRLIGLWEKEEGISIKEKRNKTKKKHTFKRKS